MTRAAAAVCLMELRHVGKSSTFHTVMNIGAGWVTTVYLLSETEPTTWPITWLPDSWASHEIRLARTHGLTL
jgi:hypothetical protein